MGLILNPRGTCGSGKTELVRSILSAYGWKRGNDGACALLVGGRPIGYRLDHPAGGRPLAVLGRYETTSGGCDRILASEGGLPWAIAQAGLLAPAGFDVLMEGLRLSSEVDRTLELARRHPLFVIRLATPLETCAENLLRRRRVGRAKLPDARAAVAREAASIELACERLGGTAHVENHPFRDALARALDLLSADAFQAQPKHPGLLQACPERGLG